MNLPSKTQCKHLLLVTYRVPANVLDHLIMVNKVAVFLSELLIKKGEKINLDLVDRASILHDMLKIIEIKNTDFFKPSKDDSFVKISKKDRLIWLNLKKKYAGLSHEKAAYIVLKEKYPELAKIILKHGYHNQEGENVLDTWEEKIVNYADKRVLHDQIVSLKERFDDGHERYYKQNLVLGINNDYQKKADLNYFKLEKEIFNKLEFLPEDLKHRILDNENKILKNIKSDNNTNKNTNNNKDNDDCDDFNDVKK